MGLTRTQCSLAHQLLPKEEWTTEETVRIECTKYMTTWLTLCQDVPYLQPIIRQIEAERNEREDLESMVIQRRSANKTQ